MLVYLPVPKETAWWAAVILFFACAGVGCTLSTGPLPGQRRLSVRLVFIAIGMLLGATTIVQRVRSTAYLGLPLTAVVEYEIELSDDSARTRTGEYLHRGRLRSVRARDGAAASAGGSVVVFGGGAAYRWGERLTVTGPLSRGADGGWSGRCAAGAVSSVGASRAYFRARGASRNWVETRLRTLRPQDRALFMALFLGARDDLDGSDVYFFRRSGCMHLLALSGFHLGLLSFLLVGALAPLFGKRRGVVLAALLLIIYLFVAGPKVSLLRAVLMFGLLGTCRLFGIRVRGTDLLGATFLFSMLAWPQSLDTLSFRLSYLALAGIMAFSPPLESAATPYLPRVLRAPLAASISAQIATAPVLAFQFGFLYPVGLAAGIILTPLVAAYLWTGLACLLLPPVPSVTGLASVLLELIHRALIACAELSSRVDPVRIGDPWAVVVVSSGLAAAFGAAFLLRTLFCRFRRRVRGSLGKDNEPEACSR